MTSLFGRSSRRFRAAGATLLWSMGVVAGCGDGEPGRPRDGHLTSHTAFEKTREQAAPPVALVQSPQQLAEEISQQEVDNLVTDAIDVAGGLEFIHDGATVVLKPNLVNTITTGEQPLGPTVNGVTTDWRVTRAVAGLVRSNNPHGKILVMEGSTEDTRQTFFRLGYTPENFGNTVDEFVALEGESCEDRSTLGLIQRIGASGRTHWVNERYGHADVVISIAVLKTHLYAGITGAVKNLAVGATPASQYSDQLCSRTQTPEFIDHSRAGLAQFIHDYYGVRRADFALIDGLQGVQNGPNPKWIEAGDYESDKMNMRLILAGRDAVAVDTVEALVMGCDPRHIDHLMLLEASGEGVADPSRIRVVGKSPAEVKRDFKGPEWACGTP